MDFDGGKQLGRDGTGPRDEVMGPRPKTSALASALGLYLLWTFVTWLLEGRTEVLRRPDAIAARLVYTIVANLLIGAVGSIWLIQRLTRSRMLTPVQAGFGGGRSIVIGVIAGGVLGGGVFNFVPNVPKEAVVVTNIFAQVFPTSATEILVCWAVLGALLETKLRSTNRLLGVAAGAVVASVLFGVYHFAHSAPFNTAGMVTLLTFVGFATSGFFFISRSICGVMVFHNFLAVIGVGQALAASNALAAYQRLNWAYILPAVGAAALVIAGNLHLGREIVPALKRRRAPSAG
jgi:hypothetical protein